MVTITHIDSNNGSYHDASASELIVKLHLQAYLSGRNGIIKLAPARARFNDFSNSPSKRPDAGKKAPHS